MSDTIVFLQLEHGTIFRLLRLLESLRQEVEAGLAPKYGLLRLIFVYFRDYPDACHHPKEDLVFRALAIHHPQVAAQLEDLVADHEFLAELTRRVAELVDWAGIHDSPDARRQLVVGLNDFIRGYLEHLQMEEESFFPVAEQTLTREEWDAIDYTMFDREDPLYDESTEVRYRQLRKLIFDAAGPQHDPWQQG